MNQPNALVLLTEICMQMVLIIVSMPMFQIFRRVAVFSHEPYTIADAVEEFFAQVIAIPPGNCGTETRWEPNDATEVVSANVFSKDLFFEVPKFLQKFTFFTRLQKVI